MPAQTSENLQPCASVDSRHDRRTRTRRPIIAATILLRTALAGSALVATTLGLTGCGSGNGVSLAAPKPTGSVATSCAALIAALPDDVVIGEHRRNTDPSSPYTAAFGEPAVTVRCGVGNVAYDPTSNVVTVNGVGWLMLTDNDHERRYLSYQTPFRVEVTIPASYLPANVLPPISALLTPHGSAG